MTNRQPPCMGAGKQVGTMIGAGGMTASCSWCNRTGLSVNEDGTLRWHVAVLMSEVPIGRFPPRRNRLSPQNPLARFA